MNLNHTTNYQLSQWESSDRILMEDFNDAFETIDTQMKAQSDAIAGKAAQSTVNSLAQTVSTKANQSDLTALTQTVSGKASQADLNSLTQTVAGHTATLEGKGNCQIYYTTYTGDGKAERTLTFPAPPLAVIIMGRWRLFTAFRGQASALGLSYGGGGGYAAATWSGNSLTWNVEEGYGQYTYAVNDAGLTYQVVALLDMTE